MPSLTSTVDGLGFEELGQAGSQVSDMWITGSVTAQGQISGLNVYAQTNVEAANIVSPALSGASISGTDLNASATISGLDLRVPDIIAVTSLSGADVNFTGVGSFANVRSAGDVVVVASISGADINASATISGLDLRVPDILAVTSMSGADANFSATGSFADVRLGDSLVANTAVSGASANFTGVGSFSDVRLGDSLVAVTAVSGATANFTGVISGGTVTNSTGELRSTIRSHAAATAGMFVQAGSVTIGDSNVGQIVFATNFADTNYLVVVSPAEYTIAGASGLNYGLSGTVSVSGVAVLGGSTTVCNYIAVGL